MDHLHTNGAREGMASSTESQIHLTMDEADARGMVARITIDHQSQLNILNTSLILALTAAINSLCEHDRLRVVILTGAGNRAFMCIFILSNCLDVN